MIDIKEDCQEIMPVNLTPFDFAIKKPTELENIFMVSESMPLFVYSSDGKLVKVMRSVDEISQLSKGIYVINGKTFYVK